MSIGEGNWAVFVQWPMSAALLAIGIAVLVPPRLRAWRRKAVWTIPYPVLDR